MCYIGFQRALNHLCSLVASTSGWSTAQTTLSRVPRSVGQLWLEQHVPDVTYDRGGMLDVVCTRGDLPSPKVIARDVGFSDHRLLRWVSPFKRPPPVYTTTYRRSWRFFCPDTFIADLQTSVLCEEHNGMNILMVTRSPSSTTTPSPVFSTSRFQFVKSPVVEGRQTCGSITSAVELSGRLDQWRRLLVAPVRCRLMPTHRLPWRSVSRGVSTSPCYSRSVLISRRIV